MSAFDMTLKDRIDLNRYIGTTDGIYYRLEKGEDKETDGD